MSLNLERPITYLITSGATTPLTTPSSEEFSSILKLVEAAVAAGISLIQLREKDLVARSMYELALSAASITRDSPTRLLINDRADIARACGADGVHLTTRSLTASVIRQAFGAAFLIGVSTHQLEEVQAAHDQSADFVVFGPVFETTSKQKYGPPAGLEKLSEVARSVAPFRVIALGGVTTENAQACLRAGASGVAGIGVFNNPSRLPAIVELVGNAGLDR